MHLALPSRGRSRDVFKQVTCESCFCQANDGEAVGSTGDSTGEGLVVG